MRRSIVQICVGALVLCYAQMEFRTLGQSYPTRLLLCTYQNRQRDLGLHELRARRSIVGRHLSSSLSFYTC
jgi:hypothetical protein